MNRHDPIGGTGDSRTLTPAKPGGYSSVTMIAPQRPKIYHILHVDKLPSIVADGYLWCDRAALQRDVAGTTIGLGDMKLRRLNELTLSSHANLFVGDCVPFYFCTRSIMLYVIHRANHPGLDYRGGQGHIVHLVADLFDAVAWANANEHRWAFTTSNAGSYYFADYSELAKLNLIDWVAVVTNDWRDARVREGKQAEFLMEFSFPWTLIERIGVHSRNVQARAEAALDAANHRPPVAVMPRWYY